MQTNSYILFLALGILLPCAAHPAESGEEQRVQVFILAGQSNMEGQGVVDLDHPKYYNGGRGTLQHVIQDPKNAELYAHVKDKLGKWTVRNDVWCRFQTRKELKRGRLSIGFAGYSGKHHIGPEYQFGHIIGDAVEAPVLLVKTAWGGKSLFKDFRPPSSGGQTGPFYKQMLAEVQEAIAKYQTEFPELRGRSYDIVGFVWFQGWNDAYGPKSARDTYAENLSNLINDVRAALERPDLPFVIGELGNGGEKASDRVKAIRKAQAAVAKQPAFKGNVSFVKTASFARPAKESPNVGHGHHWYGNAESYFLIGDALGKAMRKMLKLEPAGSTRR